MLNGDEGLLSITLSGQGILVKKLITLEPHGILKQILHSNTFNIYLPIVQPYFV